jgi:hypothetical protein
VSASSNATNALVVLICILIGLLVGLSAGVFTWFSKKSLPAAILAGGSAFAGTVLLALALIIKNAFGQLVLARLRRFPRASGHGFQPSPRCQETGRR